MFRLRERPPKLVIESISIEGVELMHSQSQKLWEAILAKEAKLNAEREPLELPEGVYPKFKIYPEPLDVRADILEWAKIVYLLEEAACRSGF